MDAVLFQQMLRDALALAPTPCQERLFSRLAEFVSQYGECDLLLVRGYAGTGKTSSVAAFVQVLRQLHQKYVLLAPTGRSAKVFASFASDRTATIHKHIYRQKTLRSALGEFELNVNKARDTFYIIDEASLISSSDALMQDSVFGSGDLLSDLISFVRSGVDNKMIFVGDRGQLPPVGMEVSPALDEDYMSAFGPVMTADLTTVVRQASGSGILTNATRIREALERGQTDLPKLDAKSFDDTERIGGGELVDALSDAYSRYGADNVAVLCRSNKRANRYNEGIRAMVLDREEQLVRGDQLMVVKNCYQFKCDTEELDFIANGDIANLIKVSHYEERYGLHFAEAKLGFPDYNDAVVTAKIILDTLTSETAALSREQQEALFRGLDEDYAMDIKAARKRYAAIREDPYFNALQIKYAAAITGHKSQGGQWDCVFIDNPFWKETVTDDLKWLYTAITRAVHKVFFVNFKDDLFE